MHAVPEVVGHGMNVEPASPVLSGLPSGPPPSGRSPPVPVMPPVLWFPPVPVPAVPPTAPPVFVAPPLPNPPSLPPRPPLAFVPPVPPVVWIPPEPEAPPELAPPLPELPPLAAPPVPVPPEEMLPPVPLVPPAEEPPEAFEPPAPCVVEPPAEPPLDVVPPLLLPACPPAPSCSLSPEAHATAVTSNPALNQRHTAKRLVASLRVASRSRGEFGAAWLSLLDVPLFERFLIVGMDALSVEVVPGARIESWPDVASRRPHSVSPSCLCEIGEGVVTVCRAALVRAGKRAWGLVPVYRFPAILLSTRMPASGRAGGTP